jgi:hypothetical protein
MLSRNSLRPSGQPDRLSCPNAVAKKEAAPGRSRAASEREASQIAGRQSEDGGHQGASRVITVTIGQQKFRCSGRHGKPHERLLLGTPDRALAGTRCMRPCARHVRQRHVSASLGRRRALGRRRPPSRARPLFVRSTGDRASEPSSEALAHGLVDLTIPNLRAGNMHLPTSCGLARRTKVMASILL